MTRIEKIDSPIGKIFLELDGEAVQALSFDRPFSREGAEALAQPRARSDAGARVRAYLGGELDAFQGLALAPRGTAFQHAVWKLLREIPAGETRTYGDLAARLGSHPRAVGAANGSNPISIVVPCHRVIAKGGGLCGYAWGLPRKEWLLNHEQRLLRRAG